MTHKPSPAISLSVAIAPLLLAGCTVGPDYKRPETKAASAQWIEPGTAGDLDLVWWKRFGDPLMDGLITQALASSPSAREALARVKEARAGESAARGGALPSVEAKGAATRNRLSENGELPLKSLQSIPGFEREFGLFDAGFDAGWEIDLWGSQRRQIEAAHARAGAAEAGQREAMVMLAGEIARAYIELRQAQAAAISARENAQADADLAHLMELRTKVGESAPIDLNRARSAANQSEDQRVAAEVRSRAAAYRLAALAGRAPEELIPQLSAPGPIPRAPETIVTGLRSDLLRRRPDVTRAEQDLAAATADIGVATADLFPRFSLIGGISQQARDAGDITSGSSTRFVIGPTFSWPIFTAGRVRARIRAADARADAAAARYDQAVANALADSESAINRFLNARTRATATERALDEENRAFALSLKRLESGEDDRLAFARARKALVAAQLADDAARTEQSLAAAALFKALGGGWTS